jgi:hypothetical protein
MRSRKRHRAVRGSGGRGRRRVGWALLATLAGALLLSALAAAEGEPQPTRSEYVTRLEGICKPRALATQRTMKGARAEVQGERLSLAATKFSRATRIFGATIDAISVVPRPPADAPKLAQWFTYLGRQESYLKLITAQLHAGHTIPAQKLTARFIHEGNLANNAVLAFGFNYCSFKFSRYG